STSASLLQQGILESTGPETLASKWPPLTLNERQSLFALIIGIDVYKDTNVDNLHGAVKDTEGVVDFLISNRVGISMDQIVKLLNEKATRKGILEALQNLAQNSAIDAQDPILVYFSGHGGEASPPPPWQTSSRNSKIQMLIPHDFNPMGSNGNKVQGIFNITLSKFLNKIAANKSDNITVILDCCYAGSRTRSITNDKAFAVHGIKLPPSYSIPVNYYNSEVQGARALVPSLDSHVLLAACKKEQPAFERDGHGDFTSALLTLLKEQGVDNLTYSDLITGEAHGVTKGAKFAIYRKNHVPMSIGSFVLTQALDPFTSKCFLFGTTPSPLPENLYVVLTQVGERPDLHLFVPPNDDFHGMHRSNDDLNKRFICLVDSVDEPLDLVISTHGGQVEFEIQDSESCKYGLTRMPFGHLVQADDPNHIFSILCSTADFYWHLRHLNEVSSLTEKVRIECLELECTSDSLTEDLEDTWVPKEGGSNLINDKVAFVDVNSGGDIAYGYRLINESTQPLYAALFYFGVSDLSIMSYYMPGEGAEGQVDYSLQPKRSLSIGFGDGNPRPHTYYFHENQRIDLGIYQLLGHSSDDTLYM
ncbi:hypothetical protein DXG01_014624, partial [Tephrocybe rancida]